MIAGGADTHEGAVRSVFISYTHADNEEFAELRWVEHFDRALEVKVRQVSGDKRFEVHRDQSDLAGNQQLEPELTAALSRSVALISVSSPLYVNSTWCLWEVDRFVEAAGHGLYVGTRSRVFNVMKRPVDSHELPAALRESGKGYAFFEHDPAQGRVVEYTPSLEGERRVRFYEQVEDVAGDIAALLEAMAQPGAADEAVTVYLAETASDVAREREALRRELTRRGYRVVPDRQLPDTAGEIRAAVEELVDGCRASIHLLGARYGTRPEGSDHSVPHIQLDLARGRAGLAQLVLLPPVDAQADELQAQLVDSLQADEEPERETLRVEPEAFKAHVLERLAPPEHAPAPAAPPAGGRTVYLVRDPRDAAVAAAVKAELEARGHVVWEAGGGPDQRQIHEAYMTVADALAIVYGQSTEAWVKLKLLDVVKSRGWGRQGTFCSVAVYVAPPATSHKETYSTREALLLRGGAELDPADLEPFLAELAACER